jgi:hypothetical protein
MTDKLEIIDDPNLDEFGYDKYLLGMLDTDFFSYETFKSSLKQHLDTEPKNSISSFVQNIVDSIWDMYTSNRDLEDDTHLTFITNRLRIIYENCESIIKDVKEDISLYLKELKSNSITIEELLDNLKKSHGSYIKNISDENLKERANYLYASILSEKNLGLFLERFERFQNEKTPSIQPKTKIKWQKTDTDFLELVTALYESKAVNNESKNLSRKDAIKYFAEIFDIEIKDAESKLTRATDRKKDTSPFLTKLKEAFDSYCQKKDESDELKK